MIEWRIYHKTETDSTNRDARTGGPGDVFTADYQTAGRGRLDHAWLSPPNANLMMSAVLPVDGLSPAHISTLPLVVGLAVCRAIAAMELAPRLKWPNDVLVDGRKVAGILCERMDSVVIAGIGVNVNKQTFAADLRNRATYLGKGSVEQVRTAVLGELANLHEIWRREALAPLMDELAALDCLKGRFVSVRQTDDDLHPVSGLCGGIQPDGTLAVGQTLVFAGEAHVEEIR